MKRSGFVIDIDTAKKKRAELAELRQVATLRAYLKELEGEEIGAKKGLHSSGSHGQSGAGLHPAALKGSLITL